MNTISDLFKLLIGAFLFLLLTTNIGKMIDTLQSEGKWCKYKPKYRYEYFIVPGKAIGCWLGEKEK